jgi:hypothetical protein
MLRSFTAVTAALVGLFVAVAPVADVSASTPRAPVDITAFTRFGTDSEFISNIDGCGHGAVTDGRSMVRFVQPFGVFNGSKVFECDGGAGGFTLQLNAKFGETGSSGTWAVIGSWGTLAGLTGQGSLEGTPADNGIDDHYTGWSAIR